ncbi:hypothetical protein AOLI_G00111760 [Acnodon oligacanthus]
MSCLGGKKEAEDEEEEEEEEEEEDEEKEGEGGYWRALHARGSVQSRSRSHTTEAEAKFPARSTATRERRLLPQQPGATLVS